MIYLYQGKSMKNHEYILDFISEKDFVSHVKNTIQEYHEILQPIDLKKFNSNLIDPIKLLFDKTLLCLSDIDLVNGEISRQRDKSNNNAIGYFHQNMFKYIKNCTVPKTGWDIIVCKNDITYFIELKNKHNTMNSSSSSKTYIKMQQHLITESNQNIICALVEVIAKRSQNIPWQITIDNIRQKPCERLRRISIDKMYEIVTDDPCAFKKLCIQLEYTLRYLSSQIERINDTTFKELKNINPDIITALFLIAFPTYNAFDDIRWI